MDTRVQALLLSSEYGTCQAGRRRSREVSVGHPRKRHGSLLPVTRCQELGDVLGRFLTAERGHPHFLLGPSRREPVSENVIVGVSLKSASYRPASFIIR